jgi:hypothetical protein
VRRLLFALACVVALCSCGLPSDSSARQVADDKVPFDLLGPSTTTTSTTIAGGLNVRLYFIDGTQQALRAVRRGVPDRDPRTVLNELLKGVASNDPVDVTTAIPKDTQVMDVFFDGDTLVVTLNATILSIGAAEQRNAFGQLVYTITDLEIAGVRFRVVDASGTVQDLQPNTDGGQKSGPLTKSDYLQLAPKS